MSDSEEETEGKIWSWIPSYYPRANTLFLSLFGTPLSFFIHDDIFSKQRLEKIILNFGGSLCSDRIEISSIILVRENFKPRAEWGPCFSRRFIRDCIESFEILDLNRYLIKGCIPPQTETSLTAALVSQTVQFRPCQISLPHCSKKSHGESNQGTAVNDIVLKPNTGGTVLQHDSSTPDNDDTFHQALNEEATSVNSKLDSCSVHQAPSQETTSSNPIVGNSTVHQALNQEATSSNSELDNRTILQAASQKATCSKFEVDNGTVHKALCQKSTSSNSELDNCTVYQALSPLATSSKSKFDNHTIHQALREKTTSSKSDIDSCTIHQAPIEEPTMSLQSTAYRERHEITPNKQNVDSEVNFIPIPVNRSPELRSDSELFSALIHDTALSKPQKLTLVFGKNLTRTIHGYFSVCHTKFFVSDKSTISSSEKNKSSNISSEAKEFSGQKKNESKAVAQSSLEKKGVKRCSGGRDSEAWAEMVGDFHELTDNGSKQAHPQKNCCKIVSDLEDVSRKKVEESGKIQRKQRDNHTDKCSEIMELLNAASGVRSRSIPSADHSKSQIERITSQMEIDEDTGPISTIEHSEGVQRCEGNSSKVNSAEDIDVMSDVSNVSGQTPSAILSEYFSHQSADLESDVENLSRCKLKDVGRNEAGEGPSDVRVDAVGVSSNPVEGGNSHCQLSGASEDKCQRGVSRVETLDSKVLSRSNVKPSTSREMSDDELNKSENGDCSLLAPFFGIKKRPKTLVVAPIAPSNPVRHFSQSTPRPVINDSPQELSPDLAEDSDDDQLPDLRNWPKVKEYVGPDKHSRHKYARKEKIAIVQYIVAHKAYGRLKSSALFREMEAKNICPQRTYQSMKNHFLKTIVNELHTFPFLSDSAKRKLRGD